MYSSLTVNLITSGSIAVKQSHTEETVFFGYIALALHLAMDPLRVMEEDPAYLTLCKLHSITVLPKVGNLKKQSMLLIYHPIVLQALSGQFTS